MKKDKTLMSSGIYLVIDPSMDEAVLLNRLKISLTKKIAAVQIWDNFGPVQDMLLLIRKIKSLCAQFHTPLFINNHWKYVKKTELDGVHFDSVPTNLQEIKTEINRDLIFGLTCGNDLANVRWAAINDIDYISFCSMFPSSSVSNCEIVTYETVREAASIFKKPIFLAGGIVPENLHKLDQLSYDGIAVISGIMSSEHPDRIIDAYRKHKIQ